MLGYLEALLFVAPGEVSPAQLAATLELPLSEIERGLSELETLYTQEGPSRGLRLQRYRGRLQLTTAPEIAPYIERFLGLETSSRLSRAALETLAIILYRQPVTRPHIDSIRGVNSDGVLKSLLLKGSGAGGRSCRSPRASHPIQRHRRMPAIFRSQLALRAAAAGSGRCPPAS